MELRDEVGSIGQFFAGGSEAFAVGGSHLHKSAEIILGDSRARGEIFGEI